MPRRSIHPVIIVVIVLALLGFVYQLIFNPGDLLNQFAYLAIAAVIFFAIYKLFFQKRLGGSNPEYAAYRKAAKMSRKKYHQNDSKFKPVKKSSAKKFRSVPRKNHHLTVIEGKKGKKKDRALF